MAIDTEAKRRSVQAMTFGLVRPTVDGTISEPDRATCAWIYAGIDFDNPSPTFPVISWFTNFRDFLVGPFSIGGFN